MAFGGSSLIRGGLLYTLCENNECNNICIVYYSHPGYFGKVGMRYYHKTMNKFHCPSVNLDKLWSLVSEQTRKVYKDKTDKAPVIDVVRAVSITVLSIIYTVKSI